MGVLEEKQQERLRMATDLDKMFKEHPKYDFSAEQVEEIQKREKDLAAKVEEIGTLTKLISTQEGLRGILDEKGNVQPTVPFNPERPDAGGTRRNGFKSLGARFIESPEYKGWKPRGGNQSVSWTTEDDWGFGSKAVFDTAGGTLTEYDRQPGIVMLGLQRLTIADLIAQGQTTMNTIRYVQEDTYTNAATTVAEGTTKPEASFDTSEQDAPVRKIAVTAKITDEMFNDFPVVRDYIDQRLRFMIAEREEFQILNGNGTSPNIKGILNISGILTEATGTDPIPDAFFKAMTKVMTQGFFDPDGIVMNSLDWQSVRLMKTADGIYIWGSPADTAPPRMWGAPVVATTNIAQGTGLVGAWRLGAQLFRRQGVTVESTNSNEDDFKKNLIALRAEERAALAVYRPKAFCTVTGIPANP